MKNPAPTWLTHEIVCTLPGFFGLTRNGCRTPGLVAASSDELVTHSRKPPPILTVQDPRLKSAAKKARPPCWLVAVVLPFGAYATAQALSGLRPVIGAVSGVKPDGSASGYSLKTDAVFSSMMAAVIP